MKPCSVVFPFLVTFKKQESLISERKAMESKKDGKRDHIWILLALLFIIVAGFRIFLAFRQRGVDFEAFSLFRQISSILESGKPLYYDALSFGGRERVFVPIYPYFMTLLSLIIPKTLLIKIIPNLLAASIVFPVFLLTKHITNNKYFATTTASIAGFVPASYVVGINDGSSLTLSVTIMIWTTYLFIKSKKSGKRLNWLLALLVILTFIDIVAVVFLISLIIYLGLMRLRNMRPTGKEEEVTLFFLFFTSWLFVVLFKKAMIMHGASTIWMNMPSAEIAATFSRVDVLDAILSTGLVPLILGVITLYSSLFKVQKKSLILLSGMAFSSAILLWFRFLEVETGLMIFSIVMVLATGYCFVLIHEFISKTKLPKLANVTIGFLTILTVLLSLSVILTSELTNTPLKADEEVLVWANEQLPADGTIMGMPNEGDMIAYLAKRKTVIDDNYLLIPKAEERYDDVMKTYRTIFKTDAIGLMQKYDTDYLFVTKNSARITGVETPRYLGDKRCFKLIKEVKDDDTKQLSRLYERTCSLKVIS